MKRIYILSHIPRDMKPCCTNDISTTCVVLRTCNDEPHICQCLDGNHNVNLNGNHNVNHNVKLYSALSRRAFLHDQCTEYCFVFNSHSHIMYCRHTLNCCFTAVTYICTCARVAVTIVPKTTYYVSGGTLTLTQSLTKHMCLNVAINSVANNGYDCFQLKSHHSTKARTHARTHTQRLVISKVQSSQH